MHAHAADRQQFSITPANFKEHADKLPKARSNGGMSSIDLVTYERQSPHI